MMDVNLYSLIDVRNVGMLGPVGIVKFMQQYDMGLHQGETGTAGHEPGRNRYAVKECR